MTLILNDCGQIDDEGTSMAVEFFRALGIKEELQGPCDDDCEATAPYIDGYDDEKDYFLGKPLNFRNDNEWAQMVAAQKEHDEGVLASLYASDMDALLRRARQEAQAKRGPRREDFASRENYGYSNLYVK